MENLKFENLAVIGKMVKSFDFQPMVGREDRFVIGKVIGIVGDRINILVAEDTYTGKNSRVGSEILTPMELMIDYDNRLTEVK